MREASDEKFLTKGGSSSKSEIITVFLFYDENNIFLDGCFPNCSWGRCFSSNLKRFF